MLRLIRVLLPAAALLMMLGASSARAAVYITGKVLSATTGRPIGGLTVSLQSDEQDEPDAVAVSLVNGSYLLKASAPGTYNLFVSRMHTRILVRAVQAPRQGLSGVRLSLDARTEKAISKALALEGGDQTEQRAFQINLLAPGNDHPVLEDPLVWIWFSYRNGPGKGVRLKPGPADGRIDITRAQLPELDHPEDIVGVDIGVRDVDGGAGEGHLKKLRGIQVDIELGSRTTLTGQVTDASGKPAIHASVVATLRLPNDPLPCDCTRTTAVTDTHGQFQMPSLLPGSYQLFASLPNGQQILQDAPVSGKTVVVALRLAARSGK